MQELLHVSQLPRLDDSQAGTLKKLKCESTEELAKEYNPSLQIAKSPEDWQITNITSNKNRI